MAYRTSVGCITFGLLSCGLLTACAKNESAKVGPSPEARPAPTVAPSPPEPPVESLSFADVHCQIGGTKPAYFVWVETTARARVEGLKAKSFTLQTAKKGVYLSGATGSILVRTRVGAQGQGDVTDLAGPIEAGSKLHLEVFGELDLSAFGPGVQYPSEDRAFRVELVDGKRTWTLDGICLVGAAG